jgi:hypothetical protein
MRYECTPAAGVLQTSPSLALQMPAIAFPLLNMIALMVTSTHLVHDLNHGDRRRRDAFRACRIADWRDKGLPADCAETVTRLQHNRLK